MEVDQTAGERVGQHEEGARVVVPQVGAERTAHVVTEPVGGERGTDPVHRRLVAGDIGYENTIHRTAAVHAEDSETPVRIDLAGIDDPRSPSSFLVYNRR